MGGNSFDNTSRINREDLIATIETVANALAIPNLTVAYIKNNLMGSVGKQADSGDIDIAIDSNTFNLADICNRAREVLGSKNVIADNKHPESDKQRIKSNQVNTLWPIAGDPSKGFVQIDFIGGNAEYLKFTHFSPGKDNSIYKGVFMSTLYGVLAKHKVDFEAFLPNKSEPIAKVSWAYDIEKGLRRRWKIYWLNDTVREVEPNEWETRLGQLIDRYGVVDGNGKRITQVPRFTRTGFIDDPKTVIRILLGKSMELDRVDTFEKLYRYVKSILPQNEMEEVKNRTLEALWRSGAKKDFERFEDMVNLPIFNESSIAQALINDTL